MALQEQLGSVVILGPKWLNMKFVYLLGPSAILGMKHSLVRTEWSSTGIM